MQFGLIGGLLVSGLLGAALIGIMPGLVLIGLGAALAGLELYRERLEERKKASWRANYPSYKY